MHRDTIQKLETGQRSARPATITGSGTAPRAKMGFAMPVSLLTDDEWSRLCGFPRAIPLEELYAHFTLTGRDRAAIPSKGAPTHRLGFAVSLFAVWYLESSHETGKILR